MSDPGLVGYAFKFLGSEKVQYLELFIDDGSKIEKPEGRLHTAYIVEPELDGMLNENYGIYDDYFKFHPELISEVLLNY